MSLNSAHAENGVLIHQGEVILLHAKNATISFSGSDELKFGEKTGNAYLTTHRLIFLNSKKSDSFKSFSFPFCVLSEVDVEQPVFGANFLKGKVRAQAGDAAGWRGEAKFKMTFKSGGAIDFAQGMVKAIQLAKRVNPQNTYWNTPPPSYSAATSPGAYMPAPPSYYSTPNSYYGWMPPAYNFPAPDQGTVYVAEAPPPYPGIGGGVPGMGFVAPGSAPATAAPGGFVAPPGAAGFANPAYGQQQAFNPYADRMNGFAHSNGNQAFVPMEEKPPTYDAASKKTQ